MAEKIISPGVFTDEIDQTFLPAAIADIGACVVGPTAKGPANIPTIVTSYSEYQQVFGDTFRSGSNYYQYLTSHTAREYLKHADKLTVVRILAGDYSEANASVPSVGVTTGENYSTASIIFNGIPSGSALGGSDKFTIGSTDFVFVSSSLIDERDNTAEQVFVSFGTSEDEAALNLANAIGSSSIHSLNLSASAMGSKKMHISGSSAGTKGNYTVATSSDATVTAARTVYPMTAQKADDSTVSDAIFADLLTGGTDSTAGGTSFKLNTLSHGTLLNSSGSALTSSNNVLLSGSKDNIRWEVTSRNNSKGTFSMTIRRGDDSIKRKKVLETWNNLTLDPNSNDYIAKRIGDQVNVLRDSGGTDPFLQLSGSYPNKSKYVRVSDVDLTVDYLDENGNINDIAGASSLSGSLPQTGSGSSHGAFEGGSDGYVGFDAFGNQYGTSTKTLFYNEISSDNSQGYTLGAAAGKEAYEDAINILGNQDEYDINLVLLPGLLNNVSNHKSIIGKAIDMCEDRGDCFVIADPVTYASTITDTVNEAEARDSNYGAMYWPWVQVIDDQTGTYRWVPPSVVMSGVYAFNDKVAQPWFAPAGLNRGGVDAAIQAERKLTHANRDTLYDSNVNPLATFPGQGVVAWGQKTLQKKASALDRVNVRRLLIKVKKFIASSSRFLVFEQNNAATRRRFLNIVNPFLEQVQANSGLNAFRVVMDESNNTPDVVDRNIMYGQIFVQPTRTAEFIVLDFTIQPTGATFPE